MSPQKGRNPGHRGWTMTIIMTGDAAQLRGRAHQRGIYSRFHRVDKANEVSLYHTVANELAAAGWPVIHYEVAGESAEAVAAVLLSAILKRLATRSG